MGNFLGFILAEVMMGFELRGSVALQRHAGGRKRKMDCQDATLVGQQKARCSSPSRVIDKPWIC